MRIPSMAGWQSRLNKLPAKALTVKTLVFAVTTVLAAASLAALTGTLQWSPNDGPILAMLVFAALPGVAAVWLNSRLASIHATLDHYAGRMGVHLPHAGRGDTLQRLEARLQRFSEELIAEASALEYQALHDSLTSLPNRALLLERLSRALYHAREHGEPLALFIMDLDRFKEVNDTLGHQVGDRLLQQVGRRLESVMRSSDTVARLGGDEFAVLLPGADRAQSQAVCRRILAVMEQQVRVQGMRLRTRISIGVVQYPEHGDDATLLMRAADIAMYEAKRRQQGFAFYTPGDNQQAISRLGLSAELGDAVAGDQLMLEYQPMVDVKTGKIFCAEALVRWRHPQHGLINPEEFIPLAEQTGSIRPLTLWVIDRALAQARQWSLQGLDMRISINLSVCSLQDRGLPAQVQKLVDRHRIDPAHVILEITESAIMSEPMTARRVMRRLSNMGFQLSIDDFGTGYSSLSYLKQLPVDEIKIDKSFVSQMDRDENDAVIVRATIDLAHNLGLKVVAEGVESTDVWDLLEMLGCDTAQGYFIRPPLAPDVLANWILSREWQASHRVTPAQQLL
jgi:diguanylate cyclase (GGDEF)-like protein